MQVVSNKTCRGGSPKDGKSLTISLHVTVSTQNRLKTQQNTSMLV